MTDRFMTVAFNKPVAKHVLSVIMGTDLIIKRVEKQPVMDNFFSRSCRFDVLAEDTSGKIYNIEVQNSNEGAIPRRARYNCEKLDELLITKGKEFVTMCKEIERFENEVTVKVASEERINAVKTLLSCGLDDKTITAKMAVQYNIPVEEVRTYIAKARGN